MKREIVSQLQIQRRISAIVIATPMTRVLRMVDGTIEVDAKYEEERANRRWY